MPGAARSTKLAVDIAGFGDGYTHRSTRGLNPARPEWSLAFPFRSLGELEAFDNFLRAYAVGGFWFRPPDSSVDVFATADEWAASILERTGAGDLCGTFQATFVQAFNPQPATP